MSQILDSIKGMITPDLIQKAASYLGEDSSNISSAVSSIVPGLLGSLVNNGDSPQVESVLKSAASQSGIIQSQLGNLFSGNASPEVKSIGNNFLTSLFGNKLGSFTSEVSNSSGVSQSNISKLLSMVAPVIASFLGNKLSSGGLNLSSLLGTLGSSNGGGVLENVEHSIVDKIKGLFS